MPRTLIPGSTLIPTVCIAWAACLPVTAQAQLTPYNPYAESQEVLPPVAADGTLHWGTFYKSASLQKAYERLWNLGACRGTNKAITVPVENNRLSIDELPESELHGTVRTASGSLAGGVVAFTKDGGSSTDEPLFAQLHPAGVSKVSVSGRAAASILAPGLTIRVRARVDDRGRGKDEIRLIDVVTPTAELKPDPVLPSRIETVVGRVVRATGELVVLQVDAGRIRRITLPLAADALALIDASDLRLITAGDTVRVKGRLWTGTGSAGAGTVFASHVTVTKLEQPTADSPRP